MMKRTIRFFGSFSLLFFLNHATAQKISVWKLPDLQAVIQNTKEPTVINFWATFCLPCLAELPHFQNLANQYKREGVKLVMISLDVKDTYPAKISSVIKKLALTSPVVFLDETNADAFCPAVDSSWSGVIPATLFINNAKGYRKFFESELSKEKFETEIKKMLQPARSE